MELWSVRGLKGCVCERERERGGGGEREREREREGERGRAVRQVDVEDEHGWTALAHAAARGSRSGILRKESYI
jgi:hypothetical protein